MDNTELAYLAGFFDGEGSIAIKRSGVRYGLSVQVTQLNPRPLIRLQAAFGGRLYRKPDRRGFRSICEWQVVARKADAFLRAIRPFLDVKADEADVAIVFAARLANPAGTRSEEVSERDALYLKCRELKQRSYDDIPLPDIPIEPQRHDGPRLKRVPVLSKPKPPKKVRVKTSMPVKSTGYDRRKRPVDDADIGIFAAIYRDHGLAEAAREYGVSRQTVANWLDRFGIPKQGRTEASEARRVAAASAAWRDPQ